MISVANPFGQLKSAAVGTQISAGYGEVGVSASAFVSDHVLFAPYTWSADGGWIRPQTLGGVDHSATPPAMLNTAERDAFVATVESQLLRSPDDGLRTVKVNVAWDENDYQIDIATAEGRAEYKRIIDRNAELNVSHIVFAREHRARCRLSYHQSRPINTLSPASYQRLNALFRRRQLRIPIYRTVTFSTVMGTAAWIRAGKKCYGGDLGLVCATARGPLDRTASSPQRSKQTCLLL